MEESIQYDNPYFLARGDNPNLRMTEIKFNGTNYKHWSNHMKRALSIKNKLGFINGSLKNPAKTDAKYNSLH